MEKELNAMLQAGGRDMYLIFDSVDIKSPPLL